MQISYRWSDKVRYKQVWFVGQCNYIKADGFSINISNATKHNQI